MKAHSQYGEEDAILRYFDGNKTGRYLDIGANDGYTFSTTGQLAERGWFGVCVEPSPRAFPNLMEYHARHATTLVQAALSVRSGLVPFYDCTDSLMSSTTEEQARKFEHLKFTKIWVPSLTWADLLCKFSAPYDFVNIDVEGINAEIAMAMPLGEIGARMICLEDDLGDQRRAVISYLNNNGYAAEKIGGNLLFSK